MTDSIYKTHRPGGTDNLYLKLSDGDKVRMRLVSAPAVSTYDGKKLRYNWVVWNRELNKPQVYSAGISVFSQVADLVEEWQEEPSEFDITVKRTGSGLSDTSYSVTPVKQSDSLTSEQLAEAEKIDLPAACKGKWLYDYERDNEMPEAIKPAAAEPAPDKVHDVSDDEIKLSDIPF